jgi:hypothetical protein
MSWEEETGKVLSAAMSAFGKSVIYKPTGGGTQYSITGIFESKNVEVDAGQSSPVSMKRTTLAVKLDDLNASPTKGDQIVDGSATYNIIDSQEDGGGGSLLILQKV